MNYLPKCHRVAWGMLIVGLGLLLPAAWTLANDPDPRRWEEYIASLETQASKSPPEKGGIVFIGSSSIKRWDVAKSFPDLPVVNHGFGGSQMNEAVYYVDRLVWPLEPRTVVLYEGDNDISAGKTPQRVQADFEAFVDRVREKLPDARVVVIGVKPSGRRWNLRDSIRATNRLIRESIKARGDQRVVFVDVWDAMLDPQGEPRGSLFVSDKLHLSAEGYELWTQLVRPHLN